MNNRLNQDAQDESNVTEDDGRTLGLRDWGRGTPGIEELKRGNGDGIIFSKKNGRIASPIFGYLLKL
jgi:hypothetical protein